MYFPLHENSFSIHLHLMQEWQSINADDIAQFPGDQFANLNLFDGDAFFGRLLCFSRGQNVPVHSHEHKDECFDVLDGQGTLLVGGTEIAGIPGTTVYVPAGVEHGMRADGTEHWIVRETVSERVYARRALALLARAVLKRIKKLGLSQKTGF